MLRHELKKRVYVIQNLLALRICASILHTNLGSWFITITYMYVHVHYNLHWENHTPETYFSVSLV